MNELRCSNCGKLLAKTSLKEGIVEVKCRCGTVAQVQAKPDDRSFKTRLGLVEKSRESQSTK
jgi:phage FluMu protein Com